MKCPYRYPLRKRADIETFLREHQSYWPMNSNNGGYVLAWNVKVYDINCAGHGVSDFKFRADRDAAWRERTEDDNDLFWLACSDATRHYTDGEWAEYPGINQGKFEFGINGRSGGYMILMSWPGPKPYGRACCRMTWDSRDDFGEWLAELSLYDLRHLYRVVVQLDRVLSRKNCEAEVSYQIAFQRQIWEEELDDREDEDMAALEQSRPDLYETAPV